MNPLYSTNEPQVATDLAQPAWVDEMRSHYQETGQVRPEDAQRLLGDPRRGVYMTAASEMECNEHCILGSR